MPLPAPNTGESEKDFISRCMGDETMTSEYPKAGQRTAVCYAQWNKKEVAEVDKNILNDEGGIWASLSNFGGWIIDKFRKDAGYTEGELTYHQKVMLQDDDEEGDRQKTVSEISKEIKELAGLPLDEAKIATISDSIDNCDGDDSHKKNLRARLNRAKEIAEARDMVEIKSSFWIEKSQKEPGRLRWIGFPTNKWRDRDIPAQIISEEAHKEFVDYLEKTKKYPMLLSWHTPGTKMGIADWVHYDHGFLIMGGLIDKDKHAEAEKLMELSQKEAIGMSHGFVYSYANKEKEIIGKYRTWEVSHLPLSKAANEWTSIDVIRKEVEQMLSEEKKAYLIGLHGQEVVDAIVGKAADLEKDLLSAGIEFKDMVETEVIEKEADPKDVAQAIVEGEGFKALTATLAGLEATIKDLTEKVIPDMKAEFEQKIEAVSDKAQKSADDIISEAMTARSKVYQPSKDGPALTKEEQAESSGPENPPIDPNLLAMVTGGMQGLMGDPMAQ